MKNAVEIKNLSHFYEKRKALDGISFSVPRGKFFGVVGPNGGGKSTLFSILSTKILPSEGTAVIEGRDVNSDPAGVRYQIGVVFQNPSLDKKLSVQENLTMQGALYGMSGQELKRKIAESIEVLGLQPYVKDRIEKLSGGFKRRVEIAKGILHSPKLLLLDEPTTGLDPLVRREVWDYLHLVSERLGMTVMLTTHLMEEAERCFEIAMLHEGKLVALGQPAALQNEMGSDLLTVKTAHPENLRGWFTENGAPGASIVNGEVRLEIKAGHEWVPKLMTNYPDRINSLTLGKPTLDDFFIAKTGMRLGENVTH